MMRPRATGLAGLLLGPALLFAWAACGTLSGLDDFEIAGASSGAVGGAGGATTTSASASSSGGDGGSSAPGSTTTTGNGGAGGVGGGAGGGGGAPPACGDGAVNVAGEQCDDGNVQSGDGCSATCGYELSDGCPQVALALGNEVLMFTGDTQAALPDFGGDCGGSEADEYVLAIVPSVSGTLVANLTGNFDSINVKLLWLDDTCPPADPSLQCDAADMDADIAFPVSAGTKYYLGIDGDNDSEGPFVLLVSIQ